jgi:hypothetical protein
VSTSCLPPAAHKNSHAHATDEAQFTITIGCLFILLHTNPWRTRNRPDPPDVDPGSRLFCGFLFRYKDRDWSVYLRDAIYGELSVCPAQMMTRYLRTRTGSIIGL